MSFNFKTEEYYKKFIELQEKLRKSEEERLKLEMKFNEMLRVTREEEQMHYRKLRSQYKRFLEEDRRRQDRNERILRTLERIENRVAMLMAKTERFKLLRQQYQIFLDRVYKVNERKEPEITSVPKETQYEKPQPVEEQSDIVNNYLKNMSSQRLRELLNKEEESRQRLPFPSSDERLGSREDFYNFSETDMRPNYATSIAEDIMSSIQSRYYNKSNDPRYLQAKELNNNENSEKISKAEPPKSKYNDDLKYPSEFGKKYQENVTIKLNADTESDEVSEPPDYQDKYMTQVDKVDDKLPIAKSQDVTNYPKINDNTAEKIKEPNINLNYQEINNTPDIIQDDIKKELSLDKNKTHLSEKLGKQISDSINLMNSNRDIQNELNERPVISERTIPKIIERKKVEKKEISPQNEKELITKSYHEESDTDKPKDITYDREPSIPIKKEPLVDQFIERVPLEQARESPSEMIPKGEEQIMEKPVEPRVEPTPPQSIFSDNEQVYEEGVPSTNIQQNKDRVYDDQEPLQLQKPAIDQYYPDYKGDQRDQKQLDDEHQQVAQHYPETPQNIPSEEYYDNRVEQPPVTYDDQNQLLEQRHEDPNSQLYQQYGQPQYDENGQLIPQYDESGQPLHMQQYDEQGQFLQQYDESGQPLQQYDESGQLIQQYDHQGQPIQQYDEHGQYLQQYDESGQLYSQYDEHGQFLPQYDENGQLIPQYDESGQLMQQFDEQGQLIPQYGENGQLLQQYEGTEGQFQQYDENGQIIQQYDVGGEEMLQSQVNEIEQPQVFDEPQSEVVEEKEEKEESEKVPVTEQENVKEVEIENVTAEVKKPSNVMEMLDTDTESAKQDTKVSNDSDFDFSNS